MAWIPEFGTRFALGIDGIALTMIGCSRCSCRS